jgi:GTPase SAR1 family protein
MNLELWDTAGIEKYRAVMDNQLRSADIVFLVFDLNVPSTFYNLDIYYQRIQNYLKKDVMICVIGNKADTINVNFDLEYNQKIYSFVKDNEFFYGETSIFYDNLTKYKEIVFFKKNLLMEESFRDFLNQDENQALSIRKSIENSKKPSGFIIYNSVNKKDDETVNNEVFENNTYLNAGIMMILEKIINLLKVKKNIDMSQIRKRYSTIKLTSYKVSTCCSCK